MEFIEKLGERINLFFFFSLSRFLLQLLLLIFLLLQILLLLLFIKEREWYDVVRNFIKPCFTQYTLTQPSSITIFDINVFFIRISNLKESFLIILTYSLLGLKPQKVLELFFSLLVREIVNQLRISYICLEESGLLKLLNSPCT